MRVLVLFAHPLETSFGAALHAKAVETLRARGHAVDDCDLNAEGFDPIMTRQDRIEYYDLGADRRRVAPYVERLLAAEGLVFSFPVWNMGFPAILKGFVDKVFLPGRQLRPPAGRRLCPAPLQRQSARRRLHLRRLAAVDLPGRRPAAPLPQAIDEVQLRAGGAGRLSRPLRHGSHEAGAAGGVPEQGRGDVFLLVRAESERLTP